MKALSIYAPYVDAIARGAKREEYRSWATKHRGDLLICAAARTSGDIWQAPELDGRIAPDRLRAYEHEDDAGWWHLDWRGLYVCGHAVCVVALTDCVARDGGGYAWRLDDARMIHPVPVKGAQRLFDVEDGIVAMLDGDYDDARRIWLDMGLVSNKERSSEIVDSHKAS